jgi:transposase
MMNVAGIDVSKGKSTVTVRQPLGKIIVKPYDVLHTGSELRKLAEILKSLNGETRAVMESTGIYYKPIAKYLHEAGIFVSAVNPKEMHGYDKDPLRKVKTDKADAKKIAKYGLAKWEELREYMPEDSMRQTLKSYSRQYETYSKVKTMLKNNLNALLEQAFPGVTNVWGKNANIKDNGHEKWIDFAESFWHMECINSLTEQKFHEKYREWCRKNGYKYGKSKANDIYEISKKHIATMPKNKFTQKLIKAAVNQINEIAESQAEILRVMQKIAQSMPEYPVVINMAGVGEKLAAQLIAEIGDIMRYESKQSLSGYAGIDSPPSQSGQYNQRGKRVTKCGSAHLRRILFLVMWSLLLNKPNDKVYHFLDKKRSENKPYLVYMVAGTNKFLKVYYGKVKEYISQLNS